MHRDVKPGNLLVRPNGTLVLTDFGIARTAAAAQLTATGAVLGTASYISPEQASGVPASPASDVYSLGIVAYQCLSGYRPFDGNTPLEIAMKHVTTNARPLPEDVPVAIRQVVERAMAKEPAGRWPTADQFAQAARRAASQPTVPLPAPPKQPAAYQRGSAPVPRPAPPPTMVYKQAPPPKPPSTNGRNPLVVLWVVLAMLIVLICTAFAGYQANKNRSKGSHVLPSHVKSVAMIHLTEGRR